MLLQCVRTDSVHASKVGVMAAHANVHGGSGPRRSRFSTGLHGYSVAFAPNLVVIDTAAVARSADVSRAGRRGQNSCRNRLRGRRGRAGTHLPVLMERRIRAHGLSFSVNDFRQTGVPTLADRIQRIPLGSLTRTF